MDMFAYYKACRMPDRATPPARMSGGDKPLWDADMSRWLDDLVVKQGMYDMSEVEIDRSVLTVLKNPAYVSADYGDANCVCGTINRE